MLPVASQANGSGTLGSLDSIGLQTLMGLRNWFRHRGARETKPLAKWFRVSWDTRRVTLDVAPPGRDAWVAEFEWDAISRVCFKAEGLELSDGVYVFTVLRPESYVIP